MRHKLARTAAAIITLIALALTGAPPALALDLNPADYFRLTYEPVAFDKSQVAPGETFHLTLKGRASCTRDLPLPVSEVKITSQVVARPESGGAELVLNSEYVISIKPLPRKAGESFDINQTIALRFPAGAAPGGYSVVGKLTEAKVKALVWMDVTGSFPPEQGMGTVQCLNPAAGTATTAATAPPAGTAIPTPGSPPSPADNSPATPIAVTVLVIVAGALITLVVVLVRRHRVS